MLVQFLPTSARFCGARQAPGHAERELKIGETNVWQSPNARIKPTSLISEILLGTKQFKFLHRVGRIWTVLEINSFQGKEPDPHELLVNSVRPVATVDGILHICLDPLPRHRPRVLREERPFWALSSRSDAQAFLGTHWLQSESVRSKPADKAMPFLPPKTTSHSLCLPYLILYRKQLLFPQTFMCVIML